MKITLKNYEKHVEKRMLDIAKTRDKLDDTISEMEELRDNCNEAYDHLQDARDALSRLV